ncbi:MAG: YceI family protein [Proteobacteria bacterium]|nr:YceI family protein [Pseudomonadota bacterium]
MKKQLFCCILAFGTWQSQVAIANIPSWQIDSAGSTIKFTGTQNNAPVSGEFKKFEGDIKFDTKNLKESKVKLNIDMNSVSAGFAELATMLKTADWFDTIHFPQASFESSEITADNKGYQVKGQLKVRDKTEPVTVDVVVDESAPNKMKLHGHAKISRLTLGVGQGEWANPSEVKDEVTVHFNLELKQ